MEVLLNGLMLVFSQVENLVLKNKSGHLHSFTFIYVFLFLQVSGAFFGLFSSVTVYYKWGFV